MQEKSAARARTVSVLSGEPIELRARGAGHAKAAAGLAAFAHLLLLLTLTLCLGHVPTVSEGPVGFEPLTLVFEIEAGPGGGGEGSPAPPSVRKAEGEDVAELAIRPKRAEPLVFEPDRPQVEVPAPPSEFETPFAATPDEIAGRGVVEEGSEQTLEARPGRGGGAGTGAGTGVGPGEGPGVGEGRGGAYRMGVGVEPPVLIRRIEPAYSNEALQRKIEGEVVLEVLILADGTVGRVGLLESLDPGLDRNAIEAVRKWLFLPGKYRGQPVDVIAEVIVAFKVL